MMIDFSYLAPLVVIGFIGLVVGALVGFLVAGIRSAARTTRPKQNRGLVEVMRIWHDRRSKELSMEIGGKFYKKATDLNEKSRLGFVALLDELQAWLGLTDRDQSLGDIYSRIPSVIGHPPPKTTPVETDMGVQKAPQAATVTLPIKQLAEKEIEDQSSVVSQEIPLIKPIIGEASETRQRKLILERTKTKPKEPPEEIKSIAIQVDEILQEKLAGSSSLTRAIRLLELPGKGVVVMVDNAQYDGVDEVPDTEVRQIIQESVAEWERRLSVRITGSGKIPQ